MLVSLYVDEGAWRVNHVFIHGIVRKDINQTASRLCHLSFTWLPMGRRKACIMTIAGLKRNCKGKTSK